MPGSRKCWHDLAALHDWNMSCGHWVDSQGAGNLRRTTMPGQGQDDKRGGGPGGQQKPGEKPGQAPGSDPSNKPGQGSPSQQR
jgi:hypothetical protein